MLYSDKKLNNFLDNFFTLKTPTKKQRKMSNTFTRNVRNVMSVWSLTFLAFFTFLSFLTPAQGIPIVICRYGGNSKASRYRKAQYLKAEMQHTNTCSVARMIHPDIEIGQCPNVVPQYHDIYVADSASLLTDYYINKCDKVNIPAPPSFVGSLVGGFFGILGLLATFGLFFCFVVIVIDVSIKFLMGWVRLIRL